MTDRRGAPHRLMVWLTAWLTAWLAAGLGPMLLPAAASAAMVAGGAGGAGGSAEQARRLVVAAPAPGAAAAGLVLAAATVQAVDPRAQRITLHGRVVALHPTALRVQGRSGQPLGGVAALRAGQAVRFALEPLETPGAERRIVLVIVDDTP